MQSSTTVTIYIGKMPSQAGPSKTKSAKSKAAKVPEVAVVNNNLSNETVESDDDLESRDQGDDDDSSSSEEEDSDEDLEDIQPKQRSTAQVNGGSKQSGSAWPYVLSLGPKKRPWLICIENTNHLMGWLL